MTIKIFVFDYLTHETIIDNTIEVDGDYAIAEANHKVFRETFPNCQVNFVIDNDNFIMSPPLNQQKDEIAYDEGRMTWNDYVGKWYRGAMESDSDMPDYEIERQIDDLLESEWNVLDSNCQ
jgi:hypothetical protein